MENLFNNPHSEVPDELWKVASPFERQMAAVEYWAELRRPVKMASKSKVSQRIIEFLKDKKNVDKLMAATGATMGVGGSLYQSKKKPQDTELDVGGNTRTKTPSREQLSLRGQRAGIEEKRARGNLSKISDKTQQLKERIARMRADNPASAAALQGLLMGGMGYGISKHVGKNV